MESFLERNRFSVHSNSKGNLLKCEYIKDNVTHFVKTGRIQLRDYPQKWGIEPVIEVICFRLGKLLNLNTAEQIMYPIEGERFGRQIKTLVSDSADFRNGKSMVYLQTLYIQNSAYLDFEYLCRKTGGIELVNMLAFDLITMNEDRHNGNVAWLIDDNGNLELTPVFDNGYALLYDDIKGMLRDYKKAASFCLCNSPLYNESFYAAEQLFARFSPVYEPTINLNISHESIYEMLQGVKAEYMSFADSGINNVALPDEWWNCVAEFINWRIEYVRAL